MARPISAKRRKQIARAAQKAAKKQKAKHGKPSKKLKIQTASAGKRLAIACLSFFFMGLAAYLHDSSIVGTVFCGLLSLFILGVATVGNKKMIDGSINGLDAGISDTVLDGIIDSIF